MFELLLEAWLNITFKFASTVSQNYGPRKKFLNKLGTLLLNKSLPSGRFANIVIQFREL